MKPRGIKRPKVRVMTVDDHELVREGLRLWLEGIATVDLVAEAAGMSEAMKLVRSAKPDIILMDVVLADGNGLDAAERLHEEHPEVKVILLSAYCDDDYVQRALRAGAMGYVLKDLSYRDLEMAIQVVNQGSFYLSPAASRVMAKMHAEGWDQGVPSDLLTKRQLEILKLLAEGHSVKSIGHQLGLSAKTVDMHKGRLMKRLQMTNLPSLVRYALEKKLIKP